MPKAPQEPCHCDVHHDPEFYFYFVYRWWFWWECSCGASSCDYTLKGDALLSYGRHLLSPGAGTALPLSAASPMA